MEAKNQATTKSDEAQKLLLNEFQKQFQPEIDQAKAKILAQEKVRDVKISQIHEDNRKNLQSFRIKEEGKNYLQK